MKHALIFFVILLAAQFAHFASGQAAIRAATIMHKDGTYTETVVNMDTRIETNKTFDAGKRLMNQVVYRLDDQGQHVSAFVYNQAGKLTGKVLYKRNSANVVTEQIDYTANNQMIRRIFFKYDTQGHVIGTRVAGPINEPSPTGANGATGQSVQPTQPTQPSPTVQTNQPTVEIQGQQPVQVRRAQPVR